MKQNLLKSVILSVILFMGVSNVWGKTSFYLNANDTYWDKEEAKFSIYYTTDGTNWSFSNFMVKISGDFYTTTVDADNIKTIVAVRHNNTATSPTWDNKWNQTNNIDISSTKYNLIKITGWDQKDFTTEFYGESTLENKTIYFDNSLTKWNKVFLRVGTGDGADQNAKGYNKAYELTKVPGTDNLYAIQTPIWHGYKTFNFANNWGWQGENNVYQPFTNIIDQYKITKQTIYNNYHMLYYSTYIPNGSKSYDPTADNYDYECTNSKEQTRKVNYLASPGGTIKVSYTDENGTQHNNVTLNPNTPLNVAQTCILKFSAEANDGYTFQKIYIRRDKNVYTTKTNLGTDTVIVRSDVIVIPEFTSNTENKTIFLDLSRPITNDGQTWTTNNSPHFLMYDGSSDKKLTFDDETFNLYYYAAQQFPVGKVVRFKRVNPNNNSDVWNECATIVPATPTNKFVITGWTQSGVWEEGPTCEVYVDPCYYGKFGIRAPYQPNFTMCRKSENMSDTVTVIVPYGTEIEITDVVISPEYTSHYTKNPRYKYSVAVQVLTPGNPFYELTELKYTVTENMYVCPNIVMAQPHTVYLHIPESYITQWNGSESYKYNTMYLTDYLSGGQIIRDSDKKRVAHLLTAKKDDVLSKQGNGEYWRFDVPAGYHTFIIERKDNKIDDEGGEGDDGANRCSWTPNFYFRSPLDEKNCFSLTGSGWIGEWGEINRNFTVELGYCEFGEYSVMCNGNIYTSTSTQNVSFEAPYGSEITFAGGTPLQDTYKGGWMFREHYNLPKHTNTTKRLDATQPYILTGDILLDDNFVTKDPRVCYLAVPQQGLSTWNRDNTGYFIWRRDEVGGLPMIGYSHQGTYEGSFTKDDVEYKYYKFTILEECNKIYFQHKEPRDPNINNGSHTYAEIQLDRWDIPMTDKNCFYLTGEKEGHWDYLPVDEGKYRLLYVEQVVEKDKDNNTVLTRKKAHPSDIFTIEDITTDTKDDETHDGKLLSLHVYRDRPYTGICWYNKESYNHKTYNTQTSNAGVILQKKDGGKWVDISNNMVFGPLEAVPELALLPGRKNAASNNSTDYDYLYYDDGIENIKKDTHEDQGNGVWNFVVKKDASGNVYIALDETHRYEGEYYIRTVAAEGGWENYKTEGGENQMTRSDISKVHSNYSHYFCKWIEKNTDVQFTVANAYGCAISDTLMSDRTDLRGERTSEAEKIVRGITLPKEASIRFSWNEKTNFIHRAYLGGSTHVHERFLVIKGSGKEAKDILHDTNGNTLNVGQNFTDRYGLNANEEIFNDVSNWVYYADVNMIPKAEVKLTADYKWKEDGKDIEVIQYFVGTPTEFCDTTLNTVDGAKKCEQQYRMRLLYDFKTNELISAYVPGGNTNIEQIKTNVMLIRQENEQASQFSFETNAMDAVGKRSYGVLELTKASLIDNYTDDDYYRVSLYWISFPFDVAIKDIFGFGTYGKHWLIQSYNGEKRAKNGLWADSDTNWEYHSNPNSLNAGTQYEGIMKKGVGYVVALNRKRIIGDSLFLGRIDRIALYFPATTTIQDHIDNGQTEIIEVPAHECTIKRPTPQGDRTIRDSHWNVIGVPSYADPISSLLHYYRWDGQYDAYTLMSSDEEDFKIETMNAYMVQYAGELNWSDVVEERSSIAAKRNTDDNKKHHLRLELQQNGEIKDYTYVTMQDEDVTTGFDFNYDLCKIINKGSNIYSIITNEESPVEVAANVLPIEETIIPLGVVTAAAGEYTFAMPDGTDGIVVELIDYETNTRTNMLLDNYTVNLGKGTFENRFALHVKPNKTTTSIVDVNTNSNGVRKFIIDGTLYMQKDGVLYDAQGRCVQ